MPRYPNLQPTIRIHVERGKSNITVKERSALDVYHKTKEILLGGQKLKLDIQFD